MNPLLNSIFDSLERCHTILADVFPHEGMKKIGGSRIFLRGPLFKTLKDCIRENVKNIEKMNDDESFGDLISVWHEIVKLLARIERQNFDEQSEEIDSAVMLIYLANGTTWNYLLRNTSSEPFHNPQYVRIEPMEPLLKRCARQSSADPKIVIRELAAELGKFCL